MSILSLELDIKMPEIHKKAALNVERRTSVMCDERKDEK